MMKRWKRISVWIITLCSIYSAYGQSGPGGVESPTNNIFWLRSDKGLTYDGSNNVTTWADQANAHNATNNNSTTNPLFDVAANIGTNNEPAILFSSASTEYLDLADDASINSAGATARTMYFVFQTGSDISTTQYLYQQGNTTDGMYATISGGVFTAGIFSTSTGHSISSTALSTNTAYIVSFVYDGGSGTLDLSLDGTASTQVTSVAASIAAHSGIRVGSDVANANFMDGHIAEIIYFDVVLNAGELRVIDNFLGEKYGITIANDHFTTAGATYRYNLIGISRVNTEEHNSSTGLGGTVYISENGTDALSDDEHIFLGHNNSNLSTTSTDLGIITNTERYNRIWYLEKTGALGAIMEFDLIESGLYTDLTGLMATDFSLITRAGTSGDFAEVSMATSPAFNGDRIQFTLADGEFSSGYYTLGSPASSKKWYVINSGNWSDPNTWTLDPAGAIYNNPDGLTPTTSPTAATDVVTILSGKTVTVGDNDLAGTFNTLIVNGTLDFGSSTGHGTVSTLQGSGTIRLSGDNLPTISDASVFTNEGSGGGTVQYYGSGDVTLSSSSGLTSFYNLELDFDATAQHLIVTTDITINNDLTIETGNLQINDNSLTSKVTIDIEGNLDVNTNGEISVGTGAIAVPTAPSNYHDAYHRVNISGDFSNNGVVNFSNLSGYDFATFPTDGAVTVRFTGQSDNTLTCNNTTNFYDFVLDKGSDQTYVLTVNSSDITNFRIFGRNNIGTDVDVASPVLGKPLYLLNGTLELTGSIFIPSLSEGNQDLGEGSDGTWTIASTAALWLNGSDVTVWQTAESDAAIENVDAAMTGLISGVRTGTGQGQTIGVIGKFTMTDGTWEARNGIPFTYSEHGQAIIEIQGGTMEITQLRRLGGSGDANPVWNQSGGTVNIVGEINNGRTNSNSGIFDFVATDGVFVMSSGTINIFDYNDVVEGTGTTNGIEIDVPEENYNVTGGLFNINITATIIEPFEINFSANFYNLTISNDGGQGIDILSDLSVSNDLILAAGTTDLNGNNLTVGRNFNIAAGSTYTQGGNNTTTFNGDASQAITLVGTYDDFYDLVISGSGLKTINTGDLTVSNNMTIESGASIDNGNRNIIIQSSLSNSGTHQSTGSGALEFSGGSAAYTISGDNTGILGNVTLNDATNDVSVSADQAVTGTLDFAQDQLLDINSSKLRMEGSAAAITNFSAARFVQTDGNASDGGIEWYIDGTGTITFPIGTDANNQDATDGSRYTPAEITIATFTDDGYIQISVADDEIPSADPPGGGILSYYWRVNHSGFSTVPTISSYVFIHDEVDLDGSGTGSWRCGKGLAESPFTRSNENDYNAGTNEITFDDATVDLDRAYYGAGHNNRFNNDPTIYYTRQDGNWNTAATWSRNEQDGSGTQEVPTEGSVVIIQSDGAGDSHRVNVFAAIEDLGAVVFDHDYTTYPDAESEDLPRLQFWTADTYNVGLVSGTGMVSFDATEAIVVNGDFGDFGENTDSYYLYFGGAATLTSIPTPIPNLMVESFTYTIDQAITTNANVVVQGDGTIIPAQDMTIGQDLLVGTWNGGTFQFPSSGSAVTVTVNGNIDFTEDPYSSLQDRDLIVADAAIDIEHTLILKGDIIHGTEDGHSFDLYNGDNTRPRVILELQGETDNNYSRTSTSSPDLYRVVLNKGTDQTHSFTFNDDFTLATPTATFQPIELQNGVLVINDANIGDANDIVLTNETNDSNFNIPSSAGLHISAGTVTVLGDDLGITLDGSITLDGTGILDMDGGNNNFIQYSSTGSAIIDLSGTAQLLVGSQIRESSVTSGGILNFTQSGGTTIIGTNTGGTPVSSKSMFRVSGVGSSFNFTGGTITIANHTASAAIASLYLDPATSTIGTGTTFQFGNVSTASGFEDMSIYSKVNLYDLIIDNSSGTSDYPTLSQLNTSLTIANDLTIESNTTMDAAGLALNVAGDFTNNGTFTASSNTTTFNGTDTQIVTGATTFYNVSKTGSNTVQLAGDWIVQNQLNVTGGTLDDNDNNITVSGTVNNTAIHTNTNGSKTNSGIILAGTIAQKITGAGTYSRIEVNNSADVTVYGNLTITEQVRLNTGLLDIQGNQLSMNEDATFEAIGGAFSSSKMVQTRRSFTDAGVVKTYNGISASPFTYPIGSGDKYTPVVITLTQNSQTSATIAVRAADEPHPNVQEDVDSPEFVDTDNVLQYYWEITSSGMTDFRGNITFTYKGSDAYVTSPFTLDDYEVARLLPDASDNWNKLETGFNYQSRDGSNTLSFDITSDATDSEIGGDYTAGVDGAIPNSVQTVTSNVLGGSGNWTTNASWDTNSAPRGAIVEIISGDEIIMDDVDLLAYRTVIDGTLTVSSSATNARLGRVSGSGTLVISGGGNLPAGIYDDFFNCATGGTLAFDDNDNYTLPDQIANLRNLVIDGTGIKSFPNSDITICNNLELLGGTTLNNDFNVTVEVLGDLTLTNGTLDLGNNTTFTINGDVTLTAGTIDLGNSDLIILGSLTLDGGTLALGSNGSIDLEGDLNIAGGTITGANSCTVNFAGDLTKTSGNFTVGATTNTFVADGSTNQTIAGDFTGSNSFNRLTINKSSGDLILLDGGNDVEVDGVLTLTSQNIQTDATNTLTLTSNATISGGSVGSYIEGPLTKNSIAASANFTFPIGTSSRFGYARIENVGTGGQNWTAEYTATNVNNAQTIDVTTNPGYGAMVEISTHNSWTITPSGTNSAIVELGVSTGMGVAVIEDVRVAIYNGPTASEWVNLGGSPAGDETSGSVTSQTVSDFSSTTFSFGGVTAVALPVELVQFTATLNDSQIDIEWTTSSEINNDYFEIEKSIDGIIFESIGQIAGNGTTNELINYSFTDYQPSFGISYYRLTQTDYDGTKTIFKAVSVNNESYRQGIEVSIFPNPAYSNHVNLRIVSGDENSVVQIFLHDISGNFVYQEEIKAHLGTSEYQLNIPYSLESGIYLMTIQQGNHRDTKRIGIK